MMRTMAEINSKANDDDDDGPAYDGDNGADYGGADVVVNDVGRR